MNIRKYVTYPILALFIASLFTCTSCGNRLTSAKGFQLPDGDVARGKEAYIKLKCNGCHRVPGEDIPPTDRLLNVIVDLGGEVRRVKTYGELVSSIINPSHEMAKGYKPEWIQKENKSLMKNYNQDMTVQQMIDLVAFLQSKYKQLVPDYEDTFPYPY